MTIQLHSDIRKYWRNFTWIIAGMVVFALLPFLVPMNPDERPLGFQLLVFSLAAIIATAAWFLRPKRLAIVGDGDGINLIGMDGRIQNHFVPSEVSSIRVGPVGRVLNAEFWWITISLGESIKKVGPFTLPGRSVVEMDLELEQLLNHAKETR